MKKIFIFICVIVMVSLMALPCFATVYSDTYPIESYDSIPENYKDYEVVFSYRTSSVHEILLVKDISCIQPTCIFFGFDGFELDTNRITDYSYDDFVLLNRSIGTSNWSVKTIGFCTDIANRMLVKCPESITIDYMPFDMNGFVKHDADELVKIKRDLYVEVNKVTSSNITQILSSIKNLLSWLVAIGVGIMCTFITVSLIPRIVHKFH